jgi:predicted Zn-dependent peptidase
MKSRCALLSTLLVLSSLAAAQDIAAFEKRITVKKLANGLTLLICERPEAPVFSFFTLVDAGSAQDPKGRSGLAHMMEHMAFKGTTTIGTADYPAEKAALEKVERTYAAYQYELHQDVVPDAGRIAALEKAWKEAIAEADKYVVKNQFDEILEREGAEGVNAFTNEDETGYHYSMPVNRLQLWAYLEADRSAHPVMREFYKERDVVMEERRMRVDSQPTGRLFEQFTAAAFVAHPYHVPTVGWMSDLEAISASDAQQFFQRYYVPSNMYLTVVGDVKAAEALPILEKYFARIPSHPKPQDLHTLEPAQDSQRQTVLQETSQPFYVEGYHRPNYRSPDDSVYDAIVDVLSNGRTSRLYRSLVRDKRIAAIAAGGYGLPGTKYPNLVYFYAVPVSGHTPDEMGAAIHAELERMKQEDVSDEELKMVKTRAKAELIRGLGENEGLAFQLGTYQARYGDWRELFRDVERIGKVTKADIRRVAASTFTTENRTVGIIENVTPAPAAPPVGPSRKGAGR